MKTTFKILFALTLVSLVMLVTYNNLTSYLFFGYCLALLLSFTHSFNKHTKF